MWFYISPVLIVTWLYKDFINLGINLLVTELSDPDNLMESYVFRHSERPNHIQMGPF